MKPKIHIFYFDFLRALAIISVIVIHTTDYFVISGCSMFPPINWIIEDFLINSFRIGIPLFLMLSGALLLGREWEIKSFLKKRMTRIVFPFLLWIILLSILIYSISLITSIELDIGLFGLIYDGFVSGKYFYQMWFFWMILGTYLIMPIFNKWVLHSDLKEIEYFLVLWLITCLFDFTLNINIPINLSYFSSPLGLVVLGYYLRYTKRKILKNINISLLLIIISCISMVFLSYMFSTQSQLYVFPRYSIFVAIETIGVFLLFKNMNISISKNPKGFYKKFILLISKYSYGIYLVHISLIYLTVQLIPNIFNLNNDLGVLLLFLITLIFSLCILCISNKIPYINKINGVK